MGFLTRGLRAQVPAIYALLSHVTRASIEWSAVLLERSGNHPRWARGTCATEGDVAVRGRDPVASMTNDGSTTLPNASFAHIGNFRLLAARLRHVASQ